MSNRCLRVAIYDPSGQGGICHYTYELAQQLALIGNDITVITGENYELKHLPRNFNIIFLFKKSWVRQLALGLIVPFRMQSAHNTEPAFQNGARARERITTVSVLRNLRLRITWIKAAVLFLWKRPHLIHLQWLVDRDREYFFINLLKLLRFKLVYTVHDLLPQESDANIDREVLKKTYRNVDALIVHAEKTKEELVSTFGLDPDRVYVIPHGSSHLFHAPREISKEAAKEALGISPAQKVILFFGIIKRYKGLEYLVEAFHELKQQVSNTTLLVVGSIYAADVEGFKYYSRLIEQIRGRDDVICVPNYVPLENIHTYFSAADVVVLPYTKTYTSGVLLTAYAAGRPVIVTDTGALSEVVEPGRSGVVIPPGDAKALSKAILEIINSSEIDEMGRYAKYLAETRYSWKSVASKTTDLYRSLTVDD
jgi:glycosyltransferase involved in cell wall biosynthesis